MSYVPEPFHHTLNKIRLELNLVSYAMKSDIKTATTAYTSELVNFTPLWSFQKCIFSTKGEALFFMTFNVFVSHIFPENFIKIPPVIQKISRSPPSIFIILIKFTDFVTFPCYIETNDVRT